MEFKAGWRKCENSCTSSNNPIYELADGKSNNIRTFKVISQLSGCGLRLFCNATILPTLSDDYLLVAHHEKYFD